MDGALLGRQAVWPPKVFSTLAGFVETGETFEDAVAREVMEEVGATIQPGSVRYMASQPWPFPQSAMIGFRAVADSSMPLNVDEAEMDGAGWFSREEVELARHIKSTMDHKVAAKALEHSTEDVKLLVPPAGTIARRLIDGWLDGE